MTDVVADRLVFAMRSSRGLNRAITGSLAVHVCVIAFLAFAPREWFQRDKKESTTMVISLSGSPGPRTGGIAALGGQPVEKVAPPPKRPEPTPVAAAKPNPTAASTVTAVKPPPKTDSTAPPSAVTNPPITGREITAGTSKAATGVTGEGTGLAQGGGGGAEVEDVVNFCCWSYIDELRNRILPHWEQNQEQKGQTTLRFEIARDGKLLHWEYYERSPSGILDRAAISALRKAQLPPLPKEFTGQTLKIRLTFVYKGP